MRERDRVRERERFQIFTPPSYFLFLSIYTYKYFTISAQLRQCNKKKLVEFGVFDMKVFPPFLCLALALVFSPCIPDDMSFDIHSVKRDVKRAVKRDLYTSLITFLFDRRTFCSCLLAIALALTLAFALSLALSPALSLALALALALTCSCSRSDARSRSRLSHSLPSHAHIAMHVSDICRIFMKWQRAWATNLQIRHNFISMYICMYIYIYNSQPLNIYDEISIGICRYIPGSFDITAGTNAHINTLIYICTRTHI